MPVINTLLIDDEPHSLDLLEAMIESYCPELDVVGRVESAQEAIECVQQHNPQLLLLDIEMPGMSGFELLEAFPNPKFKVIFVTGYNEYAIKAIRYSALDYLLKPVIASELIEAVKRVKKNLALAEDLRVENLNSEIKKGQHFERLVVPTGKGYVVVPFSDIVYIESVTGGYVQIHLQGNRKIVASQTMGYYESILPPEEFLRVHKSHVVRLDQVTAYNKGQGGKLEMSNGVELDIATRRKSAFVKALKNLS